VAGNEFLLGDVEKEVFRRMIWQVSEFSGVDVLSYCIMSNHFHLLVRVPDVNENEISDDELIRRYKILYPKPNPLLEHTHEDLDEILAKKDVQSVKMRCWLLSRMHDLPSFMKCLKQRFSIWYNKTHDRFGTFWAERFKSLLVESSDKAIQIVSAYIDLNPVRAGIVNDPKDYRFCNYAEAISGNRLALQGLASVMGSGKPNIALSLYRLLLFEKGYDPDRRNAVGFDQLQEVRNADGQLSLCEQLRCRIRYLSDGMVLGSQRFVETIFAENRSYFGKKRKRGSCPTKGTTLDLFVSRAVTAS
jgi:REP element-mobilizing transposase RayT